MEHARSRPRGARLHERQPLAESRRIPPGREAIEAFLTRKWNRELDYRLIKEVWTFRENRIAVRFAYEWHDDGGLGSAAMATRIGNSTKTA
jgi:nuclear transport factor 2 (NTF2) superfamily protein